MQALDEHFRTYTPKIAKVCIQRSGGAQKLDETYSTKHKQEIKQ
jgi:hypothetical protein